MTQKRQTGGGTKRALLAFVIALGPLSWPQTYAQSQSHSSGNDIELLLIDLDDLSFDLDSLRDNGADGLDFLGPVPVPHEVQIATMADFALSDGVETMAVTTQATASYVISPQVAARFSYINRWEADGRERNLLQVEAAVQTNCMGRFDVTGRMDADKGTAKLRSVVWHIPHFGAC